MFTPYMKSSLYLRPESILLPLHVLQALFHFHVPMPRVSRASGEIWLYINMLTFGERIYRVCAAAFFYGSRVSEQQL